MTRNWKVSKYQTVTSIKYFISFILFVLITNHVSSRILLRPCAEYLWNMRQTDIFINSSQEERAFLELQRFEDKTRFEILIGEAPQLNTQSFNKKIQEKAIELAKYSNEESIDSIANVFADLLSLCIFVLALLLGKKEIAVIKNLVNTLIYSLTDATKSFFIILFTDIFVGFHSSHGWEILIEVFLKHLGLPENKDFIFLFVATFPVVLDTVFKYWIFLYLNKISPSAVATFHNMNE
uniref:Potassium/proton antiporter CemA n=1 Tax=Chlorokybus atmophyticus TaxID=3144 RepID=CEMA_CHLAT|nr:envelope membrane protein [Chlorokybus atmophyticus]Q19V69.2 RecName: Full=Potassium/proton antiporter CemA; AltName: Full=Chloroplast envelope membrane protein A; Short=CemA [Chlorokybus atmophyticus]ABD62176.2 chloroplast enveloppe membrane protein [Chlorokybus atmophyticus]WKT05634.1 chloroplast enveloppe membrane protein [Chlorokybus atmophyticus]